MKKIILCIGLLALFAGGYSQDKYYTKSGKIKFDANTVESPDDVMAVNNSVVCVLDAKTGTLQFAVVMKGFEFPKALMQEHFNENYLETEKYPKAEFKGTLVNNNAVNYAKDGVYKVKVAGSLSLHGVTKSINADGEINVKNGKIRATSTFQVQLSDYKISIPSVVADKLSPVAKVSVDCNLELLVK
jgi:YceI-like domain